MKKKLNKKEEKPIHSILIFIVLVVLIPIRNTNTVCMPNVYTVPEQIVVSTFPYMHTSYTIRCT